MFTTKLSLFSILLLIFTLLPAFFFVQGAPVVGENSKRNNIVYTRYVRRRPPEYPNDLYVDDFVEIFSVPQKPTTPRYLLSDDEVDRIIRCDFDPQLQECEKLPNKPTNVGTEVTTATNVLLTTTTLRDDGYTTPVPLASTTTTTVKPAITETSTPTTTEIPLFTTSEDLPFLPDISAEDDTTTLDPDIEYIDPTPNTNDIAGNIEGDDYYVDDYEDNADVDLLN